MASNFDFLLPSFPTLHAAAVEAEDLVHRSPRAACFQARFALETATHWLYDNDPYLQPPYDHKLGALLHEQTFKDNLPQGLFSKVRTILMVGNRAVHEPRDFSQRDSLHLLRELFHFLFWLARVYSPGEARIADRTFDPELLTKPDAVDDLSREQLAELETRLEASDEMARIEAERAASTETELEALKAELAALKAANQAVPDHHDYDEQTTRDYFIDLMLREAGWDPAAPDATEYEVDGIPTEGSDSKSGKGRVDYVLWGDDGRPLALLEAKRTRYDPAKGQHQAKLYADCLERQFDRRPVIFCSNGYDHLIWDDVRYPPRPVQGFLTKSELELLHHRRAHAKRMSSVSPDPEIAGRSYQREALRRVAEAFDQGARKALLVMATGTGKTRTAISLVDLLKRADRVKRVLFLADRKALLTQAKRAFTTHLLAANAVDITKDAAGLDATVILSTYTTMLNRIDQREDGRLLFGPGHFDLVIVDEAHRSIYKKYGYLFEHFDALLVGLTATPRSEDSRDTYRIFDLEPGVPTAFYELVEAVEDGHLVPPKGISAPFKFLQAGIRYDDLDDEDKAEYEDKLADPETGDIPDHVDAAALNRWLFNIETVDQALELLMSTGLRVDDGDRLGKTIVFARNHNHAEFIVERFNLSYPHFKGRFAQVIDSHNDYAQSLLDDFGDPAKQPQIAVSVDMLDTGVDVPECVNLVFFKPIRSRVKFNQMIGRGTRLCPDLFGLGDDKTHFLVFDLCSNFEFFSQELDSEEGAQGDSLTARLFKTRLSLAEQLAASDDEVLGDLCSGLLDHLHAHVATMTTDNMMVRKHRKAVEEFTERERWSKLSKADREMLACDLANLPNGLGTEPPEAKQFDVLCYRLMITVLHGTKSFEGYRDKIRDLATSLEALATIPMIKSEIDLIHEIQAEGFWQDVTLSMVEGLRRRLRGLIHLIDPRARPTVYTDLPDPLDPTMVSEAEVPTFQTGFSAVQYKKKVEAIIRANEDSLAIAKLKRNQPLTPTDLDALEAMLFSPETGPREHFEKTYGSDLSLPLFIRQLVGLDRSAAKSAFASYLTNGNFTANQVRFIETLIDYLTKNGVMDPGLLYEPPFTDSHPAGIDGLFSDEEANSIISIVRGFNHGVGACFGEAG